MSSQPTNRNFKQIIPGSKVVATSSSEVFSEAFSETFSEPAVSCDSLYLDLMTENKVLWEKLDKMSDSLVDIINDLQKLEDKLFEEVESVIEDLKESKLKINPNWIDVEIKTKIHDAIYNPLKNIIEACRNTLRESPQSN